jgi:hypothetical protein
MPWLGAAFHTDFAVPLYLCPLNLFQIVISRLQPKVFTQVVRAQMQVRQRLRDDFAVVDHLFRLSLEPLAEQMPPKGQPGQSAMEKNAMARKCRS